MKQEMDERGTSMTDGGKRATLLSFLLYMYKHKFCTSTEPCLIFVALRIYSNIQYILDCLHTNLWPYLSLF